MKVPVIKFLLHSASYMWFLITLLGESIFMEIYRVDFSSRSQNFLHNSLHMVWVVGMSQFCYSYNTMHANDSLPNVTITEPLALLAALTFGSLVY